MRPLITPANCMSDELLGYLRRLTREERERLAFETGTMVVYFSAEIEVLRRLEEQAVLKAAPPGYSLDRLNGINVGCGDRVVDSRLVGLDAHRGPWSLGGSSSDHYVSGAALLAWADELPFANGSLDFIVALHILEHLPDPVGAVRKWLELLKPGGGIGVVVPDWRYTWDARNDDHPWGHRINTTPEELLDMYQKCWRDQAAIESLQTYPYHLSFDMVLRKRGRFVPFDEIPRVVPTGKQLASS